MVQRGEISWINNIWVHQKERIVEIDDAIG